MSDVRCLCGYSFLNDAERVAHLVYQRHHYRAWTARDRSRIAEAWTSRREAPPAADPATVEGRYLRSIEGGAA